MSAEGIYVYCFARADAEHDPLPHGANGESRVERLIVGEVAAVYSGEQLHEFDADEIGPDQDSRRVIERACRHESIVERVMQGSPVLPVRYGTVFSSADALALFVRHNRERIHRALSALAGKQEWAFKAVMQTDKAVEWVLTSDAVLASRYKDVVAGSAGARYLREKQLRSQAQGKARDNALTLTDTICTELERIAADRAELPSRSLDPSEHDQVMLRNLAFLVQDCHVENLRARVAWASSTCASQGLRLQLTGPWPPYNFCPVLEAAVGDAEEDGIQSRSDAG
jgi:hypothetical protein